MLPLNPAQIPALYQEALALQKKGETQQALDLYAKIIGANPKLAEAHFQVGTIHLHALRFRKAEDAFGRAVRLKPQVPAIWQGYVNALQRVDDPALVKTALAFLSRVNLPAEAKRSIEGRLTNKRSHTTPDTSGLDRAKLNRIGPLIESGACDAAESLLKGMLKQHADKPLLHNMLGRAFHFAGKRSEAEKSYRHSISLAQDYGEAHGNLGQLKLENGEPAEAIRHLETARSLIPRNPEVLTNLAVAYSAIMKRTEAIDLLDRAIKSDAKYAPAYHHRAQIHAKLGDHISAERDFAKTLRLGLRTARIFQQQAHSLSALGRSDDAMTALDKSLALEPNNPEALGMRALFLQSAGEFDAANAAYEEAFKKAPMAGSNYRTFATSHKFADGDPLIAQMQEVYSRSDLPDNDRMQLGFALSKAMEDVKAYDQVFPYLDEANRLMRETHPYDISLRRGETNRMKAAFSGFNPKDHPLTSNSGYDPIFVTGMPRSGTTLVEQIISSHSRVTGAGEVGRFAREAYAAVLDGVHYTPINEVGSGKIQALASEYETFMKSLLPGSDRVTDKSIQTFFVMGLVWLALPKSRVVVVRRDPRDNLLSIYKNVFPDGTHLYSYNLEDLASYYRMFVEIVKFWRGIAPDRFYEISYDALIADPEAESRALIDACNLPWEDACLNFHQNTRKVDTLSVFQVRQPIYKSSLKGWKRYEKELQPMISALDGLLPADDASN